jgi:hypothetical protein
MVITPVSEEITTLIAFYFIDFLCPLRLKIIWVSLDTTDEDEIL